MQLQVDLDEVGRVDLLIDGWLVVEADGYENHSNRTAYRNDRRRGVAGIVGGWVTLRFSYEDITLHGDRVATTVQAVLARHRRGVFRTSRRPRRLSGCDPWRGRVWNPVPGRG